MSSAEPVALFDLGDTLCDCTPALRAGLARWGGPEDEETRRRALLSAPGFWRELAPRPAGFSLLRLVRDAGFRVFVVTKGPHDAPQAWADKVAWCRAHLPDVPVIVTDDKARVHGDVLVDDWLPYVERWQRQWPAGLAIVPAQPWNGGSALPPNRLRDDGDDRAAIAAALRERARTLAACDPGCASR